MFLRGHTRNKNGKRHHYYSVVENRRLAHGGVAQKTVLYLGEISSDQEKAWRKSLKIFDADQNKPVYKGLFATQEQIDSDLDIDTLGVRLSQLRLCKPRAFGDCWLGCQVWDSLGLDAFWQKRIDAYKTTVPFSKVLKLLVINRLIQPGAEFYVHQHWFDQTAMDVLLGCDFAVAQKNRLYECLDKILPYKDDLCQYLKAQWQTLFDIDYEILLYDLTSTYFEGLCEQNPKARWQKERAMRHRKRRQYLSGLAGLQKNYRDRDRFLKRLGVLLHEAGSSSKCVDLQLPPEGEKISAENFKYRFNRQAYRQLIRRDGRYFLRTHQTDKEPIELWEQYMLQTRVEQSFKELKSDLSIRPIHHPLEDRVDAHIFIAFLSYCPQTTLGHRLKHSAPGLTSQAVLETFSRIQLLDVYIPTNDHRTLHLQRHTEPEQEHRILLDKLNMKLPAQAPPKIYSGQVAAGQIPS